MHIAQVFFFKFKAMAKIKSRLVGWLSAVGTADPSGSIL